MRRRIIRSASFLDVSLMALSEVALLNALQRLIELDSSQSRQLHKVDQLI